MKKTTISRFFVRECYSQISEIANARQEISRGKGNYGIYWKFAEVDKATFSDLLNGKDGWIETLDGAEMKIEYPVFAVKTASGKIFEVDKADIGKFANL